MKPEQLKEMNEITWWHQIELDGVTTPGKDLSSAKLETIQMPKDLTGKSVIDVGAWDGFFSFEAEKRGGVVLAVDSLLYSWDPRGITIEGIYHEGSGKRGFNFAHKMLNSKVESKEVEVMDLPYEDYPTKQFDLVLCLGIMYHMEDPFGMCKVMYDICNDDGMIILETHLDMVNVGIPAMAFYPKKECNSDPGTWCGPNPPCVMAMLYAAGFRDIKMVYANANNHRGVFHAWKKK